MSGGVSPVGDQACGPSDLSRDASQPEALVPNAVLVCGGRDYDDCAHVFSVLDAIHRDTPIDVIIHGNARGADSLAGAWAGCRRVGCMVFPADWRLYGKAAGAIRNQEMIDMGEPDLVVAFPGGRGTADMVRRAQKAGVKIVEAGQ